MVLRKIARGVRRLLNKSTRTPANEIPRDLKELTAVNPWLRRELRRVSVDEDSQNSYYTGMLNTLAEHCVGTNPSIMGNHPQDSVNDIVEDRWSEWCIENGIGSVLRQVRRAAARTGVGIAVPYNKKDSDLGLGFKTLCYTDLVNPPESLTNPRIIDGIEYDENWDPYRIYVESDDPMKPTPYKVSDILFWHKHLHEGMLYGLPECHQAFCLFPSVRRYIDAIVVGEEFRSAVPMAVKLDPAVYRPEDADIKGVPTGVTTYRPGTIPTLPPGTDLVSVPVSISGEERTQFVRMVIGAAARCLQMPLNIAMGDSSNHNMATAAIDIQPWVNKIKIDRSDFEPVIRKVFKMWHSRAILVSGYITPQARTGFTYELNYDATFEHPDPAKRANARAIDLASGSSTLHEIYTEKGRNARRQLNREARTLGITREQLNEIIIAKRAQAPFLLQEEGMNDESDRQ